MAFTTTHRPAELPARANPTAGKTQVPAGAARMSRSWIDAKGVPQRTPHPVPVDADDRRTPHLLVRCPKLVNVNGGGRQPCGVQEWLMPGETMFCPRHGDQLVEDKQESRTSAVLTDAWRLFGRTAAPWGLPAAAVAVDVLQGPASVSAADIAVAAPALAGAAWWAARTRLTRQAVAERRIEKGQRKGKRVAALRRKARRAGLVVAETAAWTAVLAAVDFTSTAGVITAAAGAVRLGIGAYPWWDAADRRRTRDVSPADLAVNVADIPPAPEPEPDPVEVRAVTTWATLIGCPGGPLAGTKLVDFERLPACDAGGVRTRLPNWRATVVANVPGSINMREDRPPLRGRIAAAYHCSYADISFAADEHDLGVGYLRVQPDNPLAEVRMWAGPDPSEWKTGVSVIGDFEDGQPIEYVWWTEIGAAHDLISGCSGSGKSETVAQLILKSLHSGGLVLDWVGDPQGGQSFGHLKDEVDWFARNKTEIRFMLLAAVIEMQRRNDLLAANYIKTWRPEHARTLNMPLLVITLDEVQSYIDDRDILDLVEQLAGQARKCGIKLRVITQVPAAYNLGGSTYIKDQLKTGQSLIFRAATDQAGRDATDGDCPINPTLLPARWGKHTAGAGKTTAGLVFVQGLRARDVYGRTRYTGDDMRQWLVDADGKPTTSPGAFCPQAQAASGPLWGDRVERARRALAAGRAAEDILPGGKAVELIQDAAVTQQVSPGPALAAAAKPVPQPKRRARDVLMDAARRSADQHGMVTRETLVKAVAGEMADKTRDGLLTELVADGDLRRVRNGLYEVPGAAAVRQLEIGQ